MSPSKWYQDNSFILIRELLVYSILDHTFLIMIKQCPSREYPYPSHIIESTTDSRERETETGDGDRIKRNLDEIVKFVYIVWFHPFLTNRLIVILILLISRSGVSEIVRFVMFRAICPHTISYHAYPSSRQHLNK